MMKFRFLVFAILCVFIISYPLGSIANAASTDDWLNEDKMELSAHRGAHVVAPENTVEAIKWAGLLGYGFIEIDVQKTKDGHYVLMHDLTIDRTTTGSGRVADLTLDEIKSYSTVDADGNATNYKVPTLSEALEEAHKYNLVVNFDGSKGNWNDRQFVDDIMDEAAKSGVINHCFFVLSNKNVRDQFNKWYPEATVTFLGNALTNLDKDIEELKKYKSAIYSTSIHNIDKAAAEKIKQANLKLHVYQVNSAELFNKAKDLQPRLAETDIILPGGTGTLKTVVDKLLEEGRIKNKGTAEALKAHLDTAEHFATKGDADGVVKHMNDFRKKLEQQKGKFISETSYNTLDVNANKLIDQWK